MPKFQTIPKLSPHSLIQIYPLGYNSQTFYILREIFQNFRLGFAPRSESFAIEPSVQVCSISSLSEFRFAQYVRKSAMPNLQNFTSDQNGQ